MMTGAAADGSSGAAAEPGTLLWRPCRARLRESNLARFIEHVKRVCKLDLPAADEPGAYEALWSWSVEHKDDFWAALWSFVGIVASQPYTRVCDGDNIPGARWFLGARLNFAENLLRYRDDGIALIFQGEGQPQAERITYRQLWNEVAALSRALRSTSFGVRAGDRCAGLVANTPQAVAAMLAVTSVGAAWSSCSPDFGAGAVLDRFGQIEPRVLFASSSYLYKGKRIDMRTAVQQLARQMPSVQKVVMLPYGRHVERPAGTGAGSEGGPGVEEYGSLLERFAAGPGPDGGDPAIEFEQVSFEHPVYIMYTSGTTGLPKCMVQGAGVLLNHLKELVLHTDLRRTDRLFYFTTAGWMMWNWLLSALATGATLLLYDGSPFHPTAGALWELAARERVTIFGTSAKYLAACEEAGERPGAALDLSALRTVLSTGSPLSPAGFAWVYRAVKADVHLASISGGTDINGCWGLGCPLLPVHAGEIQARGLGMRVAVFGEEGRPLVGGRGELVCTGPAPSMPLAFWGDPGGAKYRAAYFERFPGVWTHGDFAELSPRTGGLVIHGRSDATLNPGGVRIGTAELYRALEGVPEVADSCVVGQAWRGDVRVLLFVKLREGAALTPALEGRIRRAIRDRASPRHVPALIVACPDIPYTRNLKKVEVAVKRAVEGLPLTNRDALANPAALDFFAGLAHLRDPARPRL